MDKNLKNSVKVAKKEKKLGLVHFDDSINPVVESNDQLFYDFSQ